MSWNAGGRDEKAPTRWGRWLLGFGSNDRQVAHAAKACQHGGLLAFKQPCWHSTLYFHKSAALQKILKPEHTRQPVRHTIRLCYASLVVPYSDCKNTTVGLLQAKTRAAALQCGPSQQTSTCQAVVWPAAASRQLQQYHHILSTAAKHINRLQAMAHAVAQSSAQPASQVAS